MSFYPWRLIQCQKVLRRTFTKQIFAILIPFQRKLKKNNSSVILNFYEFICFFYGNWSVLCKLFFSVSLLKHDYFRRPDHTSFRTRVLCGQFPVRSVIPMESEIANSSGTDRNCHFLYQNFRCRRKWLKFFFLLIVLVSFGGRDSFDGAVSHKKNDSRYHKAARCFSNVFLFVMSRGLSE